MHPVEDQLLVSDAVLTDCFCCDLSHCGGICCVEGDSGAPLEQQECDRLEQEWSLYRPYMQAVGIASVEMQGSWVKDGDGDRVTPLIEGKECAYAFFEDGICKCAIERAFFEGKTPFRKPISCWLYPIRVQRLSNNALALNVHRWHVCEKACTKGLQEGVKVYQFLKEPLVHCFGAEAYEAIEEAAKALGS